MKIGKTAYCLWLILLVAVNGSMAAGSQESDLDKTLRKMEQRYESTDGFSYVFTQTKSILQLSEPMAFEGTMMFRKPHFVRLELRGEENLNLYANGANIWLEDLDLEEVDVYDFEQLGSKKRLSGLLPFTLLKSMEEFKAEFAVKLIKKEGNLTYLEFTPKIPAESTIRDCRFSVDQLSRMRWMRVTYSNGDYTETDFREWKKRRDLPEELFEYRPAP